MEIENEDIQKINQHFKNDLEIVSKQRLRAIHMCLRRYGSVELRINQKDLQHAFDVSTFLI